MTVAWLAFVIHFICALDLKSNSLTYLRSLSTGGPSLLLLHFLTFELAHY